MTNVLVHNGSSYVTCSDVNINRTPVEQAARRFIKSMLENSVGKLESLSMRVDEMNDGTIMCYMSGREVSCMDEYKDSVVVRKAYDIARESGIASRLAHGGEARVSYEFWITEK